MMTAEEQQHYANLANAAENRRLEAEIERLAADLAEAEKYHGYHQQACLEIERLLNMIYDRNEFIAQRGLWHELGQYLSEPPAALEPKP